MKKVMRVVGIGVVLGLALLAVQLLLNIPSNVFLKWYWMAAPVVILGAVLVNLLYYRHYAKRLKAATQLFEEGQADRFVAQVEEMLQTAKGSTLRDILQINLAAGYIEQKEYQRAAALLEGLSGQKLRGDVELVRSINLCICYFYSGRTDEAMALYRSSGEAFAAGAEGPYGGNLAVLHTFAAVAEGDLPRAAQLLQAARERFPSPRLQQDYHHLEQALREVGEG